MKLRKTVALMLLMLLAVKLAAEDKLISTLEVQGSLEKKVYRNVRVVGMTDKGLKITHEAGIAVIPTDLLPVELAKTYANRGAPQASSEKPMADKEDEVSLTSTKVLKSFEPSCLVFIQTKTRKGTGSGTGFIASLDGKFYVYTNAHVLCGSPGGFSTGIASIKTATGRNIPIPFELQISEEFDANNPSGLEDVARFRISPKDGESAYDMDLSEQDGLMGKKVIAYGNSHGAGVMTELEGEVVALGSDRLEISCEIVPGNSGGPVVLKDTNKVVGMSTYLTLGKRDIWSKNTVFGQVRRFAVRPQQIKKWRTMHYTSLIMALDQFNAFEQDTLALAAACFLNPKPNRGGFDVPTVQKGDFIIREIIVAGSNNPLGSMIHSGIRRLNERVGSAKSTLSMQVAVPIFGEFFSSVANKSKSQLNDIKTADRAPYMRQFINELTESRMSVQEQFLVEWRTRYQ